MTNRHGLSRTIPAEVQRRIRQNSRFGCVVCRNAIYEYEHIEPAFEDAREHDSEKICLLCGGCHSRVTRGHLSKATVAAQYAIARNGNVSPPFGDFDLGRGPLAIELGNNCFEQPQTIFRIDGMDILAFGFPEDGATFPTISGKFFDESGRQIFSITSNRWEGPADRWDVTIVGPEITVRTAPRHVALKLIVKPPNSIQVAKLNMRVGNSHIVIDEHLIIARQHNGQIHALGVRGFSAVGARACVSLSTMEPPQRCSGLQMIGGEGVELIGTGVHLGTGAGQMHLQELNVWHPECPKEA